jgi:hypothetical protein
MNSRGEIHLSVRDVVFLGGSRVIHIRFRGLRKLSPQSTSWRFREPGGGSSDSAFPLMIRWRYPVAGTRFTLRPCAECDGPGRIVLSAGSFIPTGGRGHVPNDKYPELFCRGRAKPVAYRPPITNQGCRGTEAAERHFGAGAR